ncbi:hypothetical protein ACWC09_52110, partial [Streptomyces sp. NPDC001617]
MESTTRVSRSRAISSASAMITGSPGTAEHALGSLFTRSSHMAHIDKLRSFGRRETVIDGSRILHLDLRASAGRRRGRAPSFVQATDRRNAMRQHEASSSRSAHRARRTGAILALAVMALSSAACGGSSNNAAPANSVSNTTAPAASTPPGLPSDWSSLAIRAATAKVTNCAQAASLDPDGCPNQAQSGANAVEAVHWATLNEPLAHAVAVPSQPADSGGTGGTGQVDVYGLYQMDVSYTVSGQGIRPYLDYSGGTAHATMNWDGTSFQNVQYVQFSSGDQLPPGVNVPPFTRPSQATDAVVLAAVKAGFQWTLSPFLVATSSGLGEEALADESSETSTGDVDRC